MKTFDQAWDEKVDAGYKYGADALQNVKFGWNMAMCEMHNTGLHTAALRIERAVDLFLGRSVSSTKLQGFADGASLRAELFAAHDKLREALQPKSNEIQCNTPVERRKHNHYFKDVSNLETIDVYRVLSLFNVTDQAIGHAVKKLLVAGGRGAGKDINKDIQESIDTLKRWQEMQHENSTTPQEKV